MISIFILEIISLLSLIFTVLNIIFLFTSLNQMFVLFLYSLIIISLVNYLGKKNNIYRLLILLLFLPIFYFKSKSAFWFLLYLTVIIFIYMNKSLGKGNYHDFSRRLKLSFTIFSAITAFVLVFKDFREAVAPSLAFAILYLLSSIILVRSLRHIESGMDMDKLKSINLRYLVVIGLLSLSMTLDPLRNMVGFLISKIYSIVINGIIAIMYLPIRLFSLLIEKIIEWITSGEFAGIELEMPEMSYGENEAQYMDLIQSDTVKEVLLSILSLGVFVVVIYIVYKILSKFGNRDYEGLEYQEEREYIENTRRKRWLNFERYPKELKDQVRYYYRKYLKDLKKKDIDLESSYTSLDVKKASINVSKNGDKIRNIYIRARYNSGEINAEDVDIMKKAYKED